MKYLVVLLVVMISGCTSMAKDGAIIRAYNNYNDNDCQDVISIVDRAVRVYDYNDDRKAELLFLKAQCFEKTKDFEGALALYGYIAYTFPKTQHGFRSNLILKKVKEMHTGKHRDKEI